MMTQSRQLGVALLVAAVGLALWVVGDRETTETDRLGERISVVELDTGSSSVTITAGDGADTTVRQERSFWGIKADDAYRIDGDKLVLTEDCGARCDVDFVVTVPRGTRVAGESGSGDLVLEGVGDLDVRSGSADVTARGTTGRVNIDTASGDARVDGADGPVDIETASGDVSAGGLSGGPVRARTASGDIMLRLTEAGSVTAEGDSGDVTLTVPRSGSYQVAVTSEGGDRTVDIPNDPNGSHKIELRTSSGDIVAKVT